MSYIPSGSVTYGTTGGTAAQGNDARIVGALQAANNLSDTASAATARTNLGVALSPTTVTAAGGSQGTATTLATNFSFVGTVAAGTGALVANLLNQLQLIYNGGANPLNVYPISGMHFGSDAANTVFVLDVGRCAGVVVTSATQAYIIFNSSSAA